MEIHQLITFLAVLDHNGFSRAAEALGIGLWVTPCSKFGLEGLLRFDTLKPRT